jgi:multimeric flavodoxin WrbA
LKKILILNGSPRKKGNTAVLAEEVKKGAQDQSAEVEIISLQNLEIQPCDGCDGCQNGQGGCVIDDDMQEIYPILIEADAIVIGTPVYWYNMTAQMKACIDRWYALESENDCELKGKRLSLLMPYGDVDLYSSGGITVIYSLEGCCRYTGMEFNGIVHGSAMDIGDAAANPSLMQKAYELGKGLALI